MHTLVEMNSGGGQGTQHVPAFLAKLWKLVDDPTTNDLIYWSEGGNSFVIRNQAKFSRDLLPLYYKHNNMASFVRQLNMYGFHKVVSVEQGGLKLEKDEMEFAHPFFLRGNEHSLELIKRKIPAAKNDDARLRPEGIQKVLMDVKQMKGRQENMDTKLLTMKRENEALWRELASLRQKHANQTTILSKILQFLVGIMSSRSHRLGFKRRMPLMLNDADETKSKTRRTSVGQNQTGPVIQELFEDSDGYSSGGSDPIPKIDSPIGFDAIPGLTSDLDNAGVLLSVDPSVVNPAAIQLTSNPNNLGIPQQPNADKGNGNKKQSEETSTAAQLNLGNVQLQGVMNSTLLSGTEAENGVGSSQPETTYYIAGADGQPLKVSFSVPNTSAAANNVVLGQDSTSTASGTILNNINPIQGISATASNANVSTIQGASAVMSKDVIPSAPSGTVSREDLDSHVGTMQYGLENLRDILKGEDYKVDNSTLLGVSRPFNRSTSSAIFDQLFGEGELNLQNLDFSRFTGDGNGDNGGGASSSGQELVSYNPSLFELAEDDSQFFDDSSNLFLDDELQSMLTTDREKLKEATTNGGAAGATASSTSTTVTTGLSTPVTAVAPTLSSAVSGASRRKRK